MSSAKKVGGRRLKWRKERGERGLIVPSRYRLINPPIDLQLILPLEVYLVLNLTLLVADVDCGDKLARGDKLIIDATLLEEIGSGSVEKHCGT